MEDATTEDETTATQDSHLPGTSLSAERSVVTTLGATLVEASQEKGGDSTEQQPAQVTSSAELETVVGEPMWPTPLVSTGSGDLAVMSGVAQSLQKTDTTSSVTRSSDRIMSTVTRLLEAQRQMMAAKVQAMAAQCVPPLRKFSGENINTDEGSIDRWVEQFEERAIVAGWSEEQKLFQLKAH